MDIFSISIFAMTDEMTYCYQRKSMNSILDLHSTYQNIMTHDVSRKPTFQHRMNG